MRRLPLIAAWLCLLLPAGADELVVGKIPYSDIRILEVGEGTVSFMVMSTGSVVRKSLAEVTTITLTDEQAFNQAERTAARGQYAQAVAAYQSALRAGAAGWRKALMEQRLARAAVLAAPPVPPGGTTLPAGAAATQPAGGTPAGPTASAPGAQTPAATAPSEEETLSPLDRLIARCLRKDNIGLISIPSKNLPEATIRELAAGKQDIEAFVKDPVHPLIFLAANLTRRQYPPPHMDFELKNPGQSRQNVHAELGPPEKITTGTILVAVGKASRNVLVHWEDYGYVELAFPKGEEAPDGLIGLRIHCQKFVQSHSLLGEEPPPARP